MNILIMGPAGAGKGTMSDLILKEYNIAHISTGDMLRENVRNSTALGLEAQSYMNQGKLVPDDLINAMVEDRIQQPDCANGYLLDGFPRTLVQAEVFDKIAEKIGKEVDAVIDLQVKFEILEELQDVASVQSAGQFIIFIIIQVKLKAYVMFAKVNYNSVKTIQLNN